MSVLPSQQFQTLFQRLDKSNVGMIRDYYAEDIVFEDPFHRIEGLNALFNYFLELYKNVVTVRFEFSELSQGQYHFHQNWVMWLTHPRLNKGKPFAVNGCSYVEFNDQDKITLHRDYFDGGAMLYEKLPVLNRFIRLIKKQL